VASQKLTYIWLELDEPLYPDAQKLSLGVSGNAVGSSVAIPVSLVRSVMLKSSFHPAKRQPDTPPSTSDAQ
jgi:hypothetical protein